MLGIWLFCNSLTTGRTAFVWGFVSIMTGFFFYFISRAGWRDRYHGQECGYYC